VSAGAADPIAAVAAAADALIATIHSYSADDWGQDRGGSRAIEVLRSGIGEAGGLVRQATRLTEPSG
jgi:hypothetical protein